MLPKARRPFLSKGAAWVPAVTVLAPGPLLIGAILPLEPSTLGRLTGGLFIALGVATVAAATVVLLRRAPRK